ncbi:hypothetical protein BH11PSE13_BH11PSE13_21970 [soil metagenome]
MSMSLYYNAKREAPLTDLEVLRLGTILRSFDKADEIERNDRSGKGLNWESFSLYDAAGLDGGDVFAGATKLPDNKAFALHKGAKHWIGSLNQIRREVLPDATWSVQIEDKPLLWSEEHGWHDTASDGLASLWVGCFLSAPFRRFMG